MLGTTASSPRMLPTAPQIRACVSTMRATKPWDAPRALNIEEYATLKALGASQGFVARIVLTQALICGAVGSILGLLAVVPSIGYAKSLIPWIYTPWWLLLVMVVPSLAMCALASIASVRSALTVEPGRVFRA